MRDERIVERNRLIARY